MKMHMQCELDRQLRENTMKPLMGLNRKSNPCSMGSAIDGGWGFSILGVQ